MKNRYKTKRTLQEIARLSDEYDYIDDNCYYYALLECDFWSYEYDRLEALLCKEQHKNKGYKRKIEYLEREIKRLKRGNSK